MSFMNIQKNWHKILLSLYVLMSPFSTLYATVCLPDGGKICNPLDSKNITDVPTFIRALLLGLLQIGIPIVALAIIYCGFLFVAARGNDEKLTKAKDALLYTIIGAAILLGSWAIAELISSTVTGLTP